MLVKVIFYFFVVKATFLKVKVTFYLFVVKGTFICFSKSDILFLNVFQFYLKLSYPIEKLFLFPVGFELLAFDADKLTN